MEIRKIFQKNRPANFLGKGDKYLPHLITELNRLLVTEIDPLVYDTLELTKEELLELGVIIIEFAEDIYHDIGLWKSYEQFNIEYFGTPFLPFMETNRKSSNRKFSVDRIQHLLLIIYQELKPNLLISPARKYIKKLSITISQFLEEKFVNIHKNSGIQKFLSQPDNEAGDVKKKLIWVGTKSYLFRLSFKNYLREKGGGISISLIDDFICQENSKLSGLGVIDILAETLMITDSQKKELRSWYERHLAYYQIIVIEGEMIEALNVINGKKYIINAGKIFISHFKVNEVVLGGLIPWNGVWYWSGKQKILGPLSAQEIAEIKKDFIAKYSNTFYRYHKELKAKADERIKEHYKSFLKYFGDDLVIFADGLSMASTMQKKDRQYYKSKMTKKELSEFMKKHNLKDKNPNYSYPKQLIESSDGIGVYFNPQEGQEIMVGFNEIVSGFKKKGKNLTVDEKDTIISFIESNSISPNFINRIIREYSYESITAAFLIMTNNKKVCVDYLLRTYKGHYYRNRYPSITFLE